MRYTFMLLLTAILVVGGAWADSGAVHDKVHDKVDDKAADSDGVSAVSADSADNDDGRGAGPTDASDSHDADDSVTTFGPAAPVEDRSADAEAVNDAGAAEAERVMRRLLEQRRQIPTIDPVVAGGSAGGVGGRRPDPAVVGVAPDQPAPQLRREGEFIVSRRGRVFMLPDGRAQFRFAADAEQSPEPPMYLMPCQLLEHIERLVQQRGDELMFVLSGQVFTYHGANWLLPSMMRLEMRRDDLGQ
jgi:hypothetical protein